MDLESVISPLTQRGGGRSAESINESVVGDDSVGAGLDVELFGDSSQNGGDLSGGEGSGSSEFVDGIIRWVGILVGDNEDDLTRTGAEGKISPASFGVSSLDVEIRSIGDDSAIVVRIASFLAQGIIDGPRGGRRLQAAGLSGNQVSSMFDTEL